MSRSDFIGSIAYHMSFTIFETVLAVIIVLLIGFLIPKKWTPEPYLTLSSVIIVEYTIMAIVFQSLILQYSSLRWMVVSCLIILAMSVIVIPKISILRKITHNLVERLAILTFFYVFLDGIAVIIIIVRNL